MNRPLLGLLAPLPFLLLACPNPKLPTAGNNGVVRCGGLDEKACKQAEGLTAAASRFSNVQHDFVLDATGSFAPGRGLERLSSSGREGGAEWRVVPTECAHPKAADAAPKTGSQTIDYSFVGVSIDDVLLSADADITPYASVGASASRKRLKLLAVAFVRDTDPQFFEGTEAITSDGTTCACGRATHFVGAVKHGGVLSYEVSVDAGELHGSALSLMKAKLAAKDVKIDEVRIGGLRIEGLSDAETGATSGKPLSFVVENPVPVAYAAYPIADVCRFAFPAPEVGPNPVEFGVVPYGREATKYVHVQNRSKLELRANLDGATYAVPGEGSADLPVTYKAVGDTPFCDAQEKEATVVFTPADGSVAASPKQQATKLVLHATSGKEKFTATAHIDTGEARRPDYAATERVLTCPKDYAVAGCHVQNAACGGDPEKMAPGAEGCTTGGYGIRAETHENGCKFSCTGPTSVLMASNFCRFDASADCRLRCSK